MRRFGFRTLLPRDALRKTNRYDSSSSRMLNLFGLLFGDLLKMIVYKHS